MAYRQYFMQNMRILKIPIWENWEKGSEGLPDRPAKKSQYMYEKFLRIIFI